MTTAVIATPTRFHNLSNEQLADEIGNADSSLKGVEAHLKALKSEFRSRGLTDVAGDDFAVSAKEQIAGRLNTKAVRDFLGAACSKFEMIAITTVIRIQPVRRFGTPGAVQ